MSKNSCDQETSSTVHRATWAFKQDLHVCRQITCKQHNRKNICYLCVVYLSHSHIEQCNHNLIHRAPCALRMLALLCRNTYEQAKHLQKTPIASSQRDRVCVYTRLWQPQPLVPKHLQRGKMSADLSSWSTSNRQKKYVGQISLFCCSRKSRHFFANLTTPMRPNSRACQNLNLHYWITLIRGQESDLWPPEARNPF